jgi:hypothetical protein
MHFHRSTQRRRRRRAQSKRHRNPYFVVDTTGDFTELDVPPEPKTLEAVARLEGITSNGGRPLFGLTARRCGPVPTCGPSLASP